VSAIPERGTDVFFHFSKRGSISRKRKTAGVLALLVAGVIGLGAYAFTAANTVPAQSAGAGTTVIGKYTEKGVDFEWNVEGTKNTAITFILKGEQIPTDVKIALTEPAQPAAAGEWVDCVESGGSITEKAAKEYEVECKFAPPIENAKADNLTIAAVSEGEVKIES